MNEEPKQPQRKPYEAPCLVIYGDIAEITENITNAGTVMDNPVMKT